MARIIIAGSRSIHNQELVKELISSATRMWQLELDEIEIVTGSCYGVDWVGEQWAKENNVPIKRFPADWTLGRRAGYLRNKAMAEYSTHLIAIWDGRSKGTKMMIKLAEKHKLNKAILELK